MSFPLLTDEQIETIEMSPECWSHGGLYGMFIRDKFARAVESATRAPLLAEIERLTAELAAAREDAERWQKLYQRAINEANGLTNYVEDRPELRSAEKKLTAIESEARAFRLEKAQADTLREGRNAELTGPRVGHWSNE